MEYWTQQQEKDWRRYYLQRKMYFQALSRDDSPPAQSQQSSIHSNSSVLYTRSSDVFACKTNKTSKIFYHYKYLHDKNTPALQIEMRKDFICPFCFFRVVRGHFYGSIPNHDEFLFRSLIFIALSSQFISNKAFMQRAHYPFEYLSSWFDVPLWSWWRVECKWWHWLLIFFAIPMTQNSFTSLYVAIQNARFKQESIC